MLIKKTFKTSEDFNEGILSPEISYSTSSLKLELLNKDTTFPFIWIPNNNGTISKVCTLTGNELGRYIVWPSTIKPTAFNGPSRTAIDSDGNCWVANRGLGTIVKISSLYYGDFDDRNNNGICDTCIDSNSNGLIDEKELLPWGADECVLSEIILFGDNPGPYRPGDYVKDYDSSIYPRALAIDNNNYLWVGTYDSMKYYKIDCESCEIISILDLSSWNHHPYGAVIDKYGFLWSSSGPSKEKDLLKIDTNKGIVVSKISHLHGLTPYCLCLDQFDHLFISGWTSNKLARLNIITNSLEWIYTYMFVNNCRGITCTSDGDIWVANSEYNTLSRYSNEGNFKTSINVCRNPCALSVDACGNVWVCGLNDESICMVNSSTNKVDLIKVLKATTGHYAYSDMTGIICRSITNRFGNWNVVFDSKNPNTIWNNISWLCDEPPITSITVHARSSNDKIKWTDWEGIVNKNRLTSICGGQYLEISVCFKTLNSTTPTLSQLDIEFSYPQTTSPSEVASEIYPLNISINSEIETILNLENIL